MNGASPSSAKRNQLSSETSPYLLSASHQPVFWYPWGELAFTIAREENKPVLLDIGAVWCHWCHVMDAESYDNEGTAKIINDHYVAIKVDRDERPDVDSRYQAAISAISGQGGWPLTAFLTPNGDAFYGGTYFPSTDRYGRMGFPKILKLLAEAYRNEPAKVVQNAEHVKSAVQNHSVNTQSQPFALETASERAISDIIAQIDPKNGGFGTAPKFPHCSAVEFLIASYDRQKNKRFLEIADVTLRAMASGGIYDQLGGGFHRYSTDERWMVPHFEKMLYDNAALLANYVHVYLATRDDFHRDIALDIIRFADTVLSDRERGGFFASQDADVAVGDDGSYFTWTLAELKNSLDPLEFETIRMTFGVSETGQMHGDPTQNVLHIEKRPEDIALELHKSVTEIVGILDSARGKLLKIRSARSSPYVDKTVYADWNGMMISAYLEAYKTFQREELLNFALASLERVLTEHSKPDRTISHRRVSTSPEAFLSDQVETAKALLHAFEVTTESQYLERARLLMDRTIDTFFDQKTGGFFDIPAGSRGIGLLTINMKPIHDSPVESANAIAISVLNRLYAFTQQIQYRDIAEKTLKHFVGVTGNNALYSSAYFLSLEEFLFPPPHVVIVSRNGDERGKKLVAAALKTFRPGKTVATYDPFARGILPDTVKGSVRTYSQPVAFVCSQFACAPPVYDPEVLTSTIESFGRN